jgi:ribokinase
MLTGQKPIVVVGSINLDFVTNAEHIPAVGETVLGNNFQMHPGGKGANQAVAIARLGYPVQLVGRLGADLPGKQLRSHLESVGVGLNGVEESEGSSGVAVIIVSDQGENCIVVTPGANADVTPALIDRHLPLIREAGLVLAQLEIPIATVEYLAAVCNREGIPLMLDPAPAKTLPKELLRLVRWFTPNETEAAFYAHEAQSDTQSITPADTARLIAAHGPQGILLKMGARGAFLADNGYYEQFSPMEVQVLDTTAAGDAFNGAFAVGLMLNKPPSESARFAIAASALSVTRAGAQPSMPTRQEVEQLLNVPTGFEERV